MIKGYNALTDPDKKIFDSFCNHYRQANSSDIEIEFLSVKREENYLRVDLLKNGRRTWQQVFSGTTWG